MRKVIVLLVVLCSLGLAAEYRFSTGAWDQPPTKGGTSYGWGEWFVTTFENDTGEDISITELGMPCCGPPSGDYGWVVWYDVGGLRFPPGTPQSADEHGSYTPEDGGSTNPPVTYTYVDLSGEDVVIEEGTYFAIGYDVTRRGGQVPYNGYCTWAWYSGWWDPDYDWGVTALIQCRAESAIPDPDPPYVDGMDPDDGDGEVPSDSDVVFHCRDAVSGVDVSTVDFVVRETSLAAGRAVSPGVALSVASSRTGIVEGDLDVDDGDLYDVVCTFTATDGLPEAGIITCTVDGGLTDRRGNGMGEDFVWTFDTEGAVEGSTWGRIKTINR
jgi:hypothetical protein